MRLLILVALSGLTTYLVNSYSFTLAHSAAGILAVVACPGILIIVANLLTGALGWVAAIAVNAVYYELIWKLIRRRPNQR